MQFDDVYKNVLQNMGICSVFQNVFIYPDDEYKYEPTPAKQYEMINSQNLLENIKIAGAMFIKGMDTQFWDLIKGDMDTSELDNVENDLPIIWIAALIWKQQFEISEFDISNSDISNSDISNSINKSSNYFYVVKASINTYQIKQLEIGDEMIPAKYNINEILEFSSGRSKNNLHLYDLGSLQIANINKNKNGQYSIYCWIDNVRYILRPFATRISAAATVESDEMIYNFSYPYKWCQLSKVIFITEYIDCAPDSYYNGNVIEKKCYYTIAPAPPYIIHMDDMKSDNMELLNCIKYIFGIPRNLNNCGLYKFQDTLRICSFIHGGIMSDLKSKLNVIKLNDSEKKWIQSISQKIDRKYYMRLCEVITAYNISI